MKESRTAETAQEMWDYIHEYVLPVGGTGPFDITLLLSETKHAYFLYTIMMPPPTSA